MNHIHVPSHPKLKLGRKLGVRTRHHPRVIPFNTVKAAHGPIRDALAQPIATFDYRDGLPNGTDVLANDRLGCCTASAKGHRAQQFTAFRGLTPLDIPALTSSVIKFYSETTGYNADAPLDADGSNPTDDGGDMQKIAEFLVDTGFPMPDGTRDKFAFAISIDPTQEADLAFCGLHCQGVDFGIVVTDTVMPANGAPPPEDWTVLPNEKQLGGHDVISMARLANGRWVVDSWGTFYTFDQEFGGKNVELAFAYVSDDMLRDNKTVMGLGMSSWQQIIASHGQVA